MVVLKQLNHCEVLLIASEAKDSARMRYEEWKASERVGVFPGRDLNPGVVHDVSGESVGIFSPLFTSTQRLQKHQGHPKQQQMGNLMSGMAFREKVNQVKPF